MKNSITIIYTHFLLSLCLLALMASCSKDPRWNPTWALPIIKQTELKVEDFSQQGQASKFAKQLGVFWEKEIKTLEQKEVNSLAYKILIDTTQSLSFVEYKNEVPTLKTDIIEQLELTEEDTKIVNEFLARSPSIKISENSFVKKKELTIIADGDKVIQILLKGLTKNAKDVFILAGNFITSFPSNSNMKNDINKELQSFFGDIRMQDSLEINLKNLIGVNPKDVNSAVFKMDIINNLPFRMTPSAVFSMIDSTKTDLYSDTNPIFSGETENLSVEFKEEQVESIITNATGLLVSINLELENQEFEGKDVKTLGKMGFLYDFRIKANAKIKAN
ncbi:MAG: hypothetical protein ACRCSB_04375 [Bacteroidales bacterium]